MLHWRIDEAHFILDNQTFLDFVNKFFLNQRTFQICDFGLARVTDPTHDHTGLLTEYVATRWVLILLPCSSVAFGQNSDLRPVLDTFQKCFMCVQVLFWSRKKTSNFISYLWLYELVQMVSRTGDNAQLERLHKIDRCLVSRMHFGGNVEQSTSVSGETLS